MCTASWSLLEGGGYDLFFSRDERIDRPRAEPPRRDRAPSGWERLYPVDAEAGGAWIAVNGRGLTAGLLNHYAAATEGAEAPAGAGRTRGEIPLAMTEESDAAAALERLERMDLSEYRPFIVCLLDPTGRALLRVWDGRRLEPSEAPDRFLTTSSHRPGEVTAYRRRRYREICGPEGDAVRRERYHCDASHPDPAFNPLMRRSDAETQCLTRARVSAETGKIVLAYAPRAPGSNAFDPAVERTLPLEGFRL